MPINQFEKTSEGWFERRVGLIDDKLKLILKKTFLKFEENYGKNGDIDEISPYANLYLKRIFSHLKEFGGGLLIFDYGPLKKRKLIPCNQYLKKKKATF